MKKSLFSLLVLLMMAGCAQLQFPTGREPTSPPPPTVEDNPPFATPTTAPDQTSTLPEPTAPEPADTPTPEVEEVPTEAAIEEPPELPAEPLEPLITFGVEEGTPAFRENFAYPELGCEWMGAGGQVLLANGDSAEGYEVRVEGNIAGETITGSATTGQFPDYGPGGYEIQLADQSAPGIFWIELYDPEGRRVSEAVNFITPGDCGSNLVVVNFFEFGAE